MSEVAQPATPNGDGPFERTLGLAQVTTSGVALIIGAGVYVLLAPATARAGSLVWVSFIVAAVLCGLSAFSYMEMVSMFPKAGSEHEFARQVFPMRFAFVVGWAMALALVVASATVALGFARYFAAFVEVEERVGALGILTLVAVVSWLGMGRAIRVVMAFAIVEVGGLLLAIVIGIPRLGDHSLTSGGSLDGVLSAAALIFFAYIGFDEVTSLSEEALEPERTMPRALLLALVISTVLYTGVAIAGVSVLGAEELGRSTRPMADILESGLGGSSSDVVSLIALFSTASTVLLALTAAARIMFGMASTGHLPEGLSRVHKGRVPLNSLVLSTVMAAALILLEDLDLLAAATDALVYLMFLVTNSALIILRKRRPDAPRPFKVRGSIGWLPIVPSLAVVVTVTLAFRLEGRAVLLALGLLAVGSIVREVGGHRMSPVIAEEATNQKPHS
ncbi:MAG: APC family permease [Ilumatobacteraceae bacterium]